MVPVPFLRFGVALFFLLGCSLSAPVFSQAYFLDGAALRQALRTLNGSAGASWGAVGYVQAVADDMAHRRAMTDRIIAHPPQGTDLSSLRKAGQSTTSCVPPRATTEQLILVVLNWLDENPSTWTEPASILIARALIAGFPCSYL